MQRGRLEDVRAWLQAGPPLSEMKERFPAEWEAVQRELGAVLAKEDLQAVKDYAATVAKPPAVSRGGAAGRGREDALMSAQVRQHMAAEALRQMGVAAATGVTEGKLRFNLVNGYLAQKLLFSGGLRRKPVSLFWFRLVWPLLWQKKFLMPLVQPRGIYNFYSKQLIAELAKLIGDRSALEIAAGDGTLSRFLAEAGVRITATDDYSWDSSVTYPEDVRREEARQALRKHQPQVVICSWPPAGNGFERWVFETKTVEMYIVISSHHEFAAGNWDAYRRQSAFEFEEDGELSRLVLPPEIESAVYVFRRQGT